MASEIQNKDIAPIVWANSVDYSPTVSGLSRTAQIDLTSLGTGAARQGAKVDLGANRYFTYDVFIGTEYATATTPGELVRVYFGESSNSTPGNANPGGLTGIDAVYTGTAGDTLANSLKQLLFAGSLITTSDATTIVQYQKIGVLNTPMRYVIPVCRNDAGSDIFVADAIEMFIALLPRTPEIQ